MASEALAHPLTGEALDPDNLADLRAAKEAFYDWAQANYWPKYHANRAVEGRILELAPPYELPPRRSQSDVQQKIDRCPRCKTQYVREAA